MSQDALLRCRCGNVTGHVSNPSRETVNRIVCYCDDCQAFLHHLGRAELLDAHGGTDIVQVAPAALSFEHGTEHIACVRLKPRGLYRHYASCCKTPLGNTLSPAMPYVGLLAQIFDGGEGRGADAYFGPPIGAMFGKFAVGHAPEGSVKPNLRLLIRAVRMVLGWRLGGKAWPHPFFDRATRKPTRPISVLSATEREALRPLCGPRPGAAT